MHGLTYRPERVLRAAAVLVTVLGCLVPRGLAQGDQSAAHIATRPQAREEAAADPSLKTHSSAFKVDVDLVLIPVTVTDPMNRLVVGLEKDSFLVYEGKDQQEVQQFSSEDAPASIGVVFDESGSMSNKIDKAKAAVMEFFRTANLEDEFFMIAFQDKPELIADFTNSIENIQGRLPNIQPSGRTALLDAIYVALNKMRGARYQKRALLIISDGGDNFSDHSEAEIKMMAEEADVQIFAIGLFDSHFATKEESQGPGLLSEVAYVSGGQAYTVRDINELSDVATKIGSELRHQYVLGYRPKKPAHDGTWRRVKVKLIPPKGMPPLHVYAKSGYYASKD